MRHTYSSPLITDALDAIVAELTLEFSGVFSRDTIERFVDESFEAFKDRTIFGQNIGISIVRRFGRERLQALAQAEGLVAKTTPEVLFICEHNAGRSQMAAALTHHLSAGAVAVRSAGAHPEETILPLVIEAMREIGVDVTHEFPKPLSDEVVRAADVVITMGCGDACAVYPGKRYEDWAIADPDRQTIEAVRRIRYDIYHHVSELITRLEPHPES